LLDSGAASIVQMNVGRVGGLLEAKKVASLAEVYYAQIAPHLYNGPVGAAASIVLGACTPNFLMQESIGTWDGFHARVLKQPIQWEDGYLIPSKAPGLGIELDMDVVRAHAPYTGKRLHLEMQREPADVRDTSPARG
jgi:L-alanine-DL-glutamate epimerase-like enolase superfamily enzyme